MWHEWGRADVSTRFWWEDMGERDHLEDTGVDGRITLKWIFKEWDGEAWTRFIWFRIGGWRL